MNTIKHEVIEYEWREHEDIEYEWKKHWDLFVDTSVEMYHWIENEILPMYHKICQLENQPSELIIMFIWVFSHYIIQYIAKHKQLFINRYNARKQFRISGLLSSINKLCEKSTQTDEIEFSHSICDGFINFT